MVAGGSNAALQTRAQRGNSGLEMSDGWGIKETGPGTAGPQFIIEEVASPLAQNLPASPQRIKPYRGAPSGRRPRPSLGAGAQNTRKHMQHIRLSPDLWGALGLLEGFGADHGTALREIAEDATSTPLRDPEGRDPIADTEREAVRGAGRECPQNSWGGYVPTYPAPL